MHQLAIVVPAWKSDFFRSALESIQAQTDRRFTVYVADDGAPAEVGDICRTFDDLELVYHRFEENLGGTSLVGHWNRAIERTSEPWVWLFGDDDEMHPECVARFYDALGDLDPGVSVLRFDTDVIDEAGRVRDRNTRHPGEEVGAEFIYDRLLGRRNSYVIEYIFRRSAFDHAGGFPDYPAAWCADDTAWFTFAAGHPIVTLPGPRVRWRASRVNITGANQSHQNEKIQAGRRFLDFVKTTVEPGDAERTPEDWATARSRWFEDQVRYLSPLPGALLRDVIGPDSPWARSRIERMVLAHMWTLRARVRGAIRRLVGG